MPPSKSPAPTSSSARETLVASSLRLCVGAFDATPPLRVICGTSRRTRDERWAVRARALNLSIVPNRSEEIALAAAVIVVAAVPGAVTASPDRDDRVRHGSGIGRLKLGVTYSEVRRILGGPQTVERREKLSRGRRYIEFG
jgi:hypothetical protein